MNKVKIFLLLSGYQLTWLMCVFGEILFHSAFPGVIGGCIFLFLVLLNSNNVKKLVFIIFSISVAGYIFDSTLIILKIYSFNTSLNIGWLPVWMIVLWPSFAILFDEVFVFLEKYKLIGVMLSAILGPLTYYTGVPLGLIEIKHLYLFIFLMIIFWSCLMLVYLKFLLKFKFQ